MSLLALGLRFLAGHVAGIGGGIGKNAPSHLGELANPNSDLAAIKAAIEAEGYTVTLIG